MVLGYNTNITRDREAGFAMTDKELRKLKRAELLEMLIEQGKVMEELREQLEIANKKLTDRRIMIDQSGSIAEASLQLNGVFEAAQAAAQQYLENVEKLSGRQEQICADMDRETRERCEAMEQETKRRCETMERETKQRCDAMDLEAKKSVEERWNELSSRLENFYNEHKDLRKLLEIAGGTQAGE